MTRISIIIRCYNEEEHIGRLLRGIVAQAETEFEIIVVDSGSTDQTVEIAHQFPIKLVTIKPEQFSFGRSLNIGCQAATGEFLVFASAHVYPVYGDWLSKLIAPFQDEAIGLVYGRQRGNEITKFSEHQIFARWFPEQSDFDQSHPFCNNANVAIRRQLWEKFPYDEELTGLEDIAWAKEIMKAGHKIAYHAEAEIIHVHSESPKRTYNRYRREAIALKNIFPDQRFHLASFLRLFVSNSFADYYYAAKERVLFKNLVAIPQFRLMQFWGTYKGYQQKDLAIDTLRQTLYYPRELKPATGESNQISSNKKPIDYRVQPKRQGL